MKKILVAYGTNAGSTVEVAQAVGEELAKDNSQVDIHEIKEVTTVEGYEAVVVGAPMIMGWHLSAVNFVKKHEKALSQLRVAYFMTAMSLTNVDHRNYGEIAISVDPKLAKPPKTPGRLSFREKYATVDNYLPTALNASHLIKPASAAFFGGKLDLMRLKLWQKLFVLLVVQAQPGDYRNWPFIREWAASLKGVL